MIRERLKAAAAAVSGSVQRGAVRLWNTWREHAFPRITFRRLVQDGYAKHAVVFRCVTHLATTFPEPPLRVYEREGDGQSWLYDHECQYLLDEPNPDMSDFEYWEYIITYMAVGGLAAGWKERNKKGDVIALWPLHRAQIAPAPDPNGWLSHWVYDPGDGTPKVAIPPSEIIPYRYAVDPLSPLDGLSPLVACARAVDTGNEGMRYAFALLKNDAVVRTAVEVKGPMSDLIRDKMKQAFIEGFGGDNRGMPIVVEGQDIEIKRIGANLQELAGDALHNVPDSWICMAFGVPQTLIGTNSGTQRAIQGAPRELQEFWTETGRVPLWVKLARVMTRHLLRPEFKAGRELVLEFDLSKVRALAEDEIAKMDAITRAVGGPWMRVFEGRLKMGLPRIAGDGILLRAATLLEVEAPDIDPDQVIDATARLVDETAAASPTATLNGAQIQALIAMLQLIGTGPGQFPRDAVREMILVSFPVDEARADRILSAIPAEGVGLPEGTKALALPPVTKGSIAQALRARAEAQRELERQMEAEVADALSALGKAVASDVG